MTIPEQQNYKRSITKEQFSFNRNSTIYKKNNNNNIVMDYYNYYHYRKIAVDIWKYLLRSSVQNERFSKFNDKTKNYEN